MPASTHAVRQILNVLQHDFPSVFPQTARFIFPLSVGVDLELHAFYRGRFELNDIRRALRVYTNTPGYRIAVLKCRFRTKLDGQRGEEVSLKDRAHALYRLSLQADGLRADLLEKINLFAKSAGLDVPKSLAV